jgi:hypothetical protein
VGNASCATANAATPRAYAPFNIGDVGTNGGISIAGEPMVVSFMDTASADATTGTPGFVAVFVRVSHVYSHDGTIGAYHNAIFYTLSYVTGVAPPASGDTWQFDKIAKWTPWMPVRDAGNTLFRIQGNPLVFFKKMSGAVNLFIFGTQSTALHPPIAPINIFAAPAAPAPWALSAPFFNYGNTLIRSSVALTTAAGAVIPAVSNLLNAAAHTLANSLPWRTVTAATDALSGIVVSDWT